ncbi:MAG: hypothetical protein ABS79_02025 [Planctomycetes bacterium SCN 63-9]|nr:MAG: hypothetical protein ABS79_02025 [Planctomycetes bacterium SCN 63-9]
MVNKAVMSVWVILVLGMLQGCGSGDNLPREPISGTVSLDGEPLESGNITFTPASNTETSAASAAITSISEGRFSLDAAVGLVPGKYVVIISSPVAGKPAAPAKSRRSAPGVADTVSGTGADDAVEEPPTREIIPIKYNTQSTLKADVTKGGPNQFEFSLSTKS